MKNLSNDLAALKIYMSKCKTVSEWNETREAAKGLFTGATISQLDASAYIKKVLI